MTEPLLRPSSTRLVAGALSQLVRHQVAAHGLLVWFDPERRYEAMLPELDLGDAALHCYTGSFFELRHAIEPRLRGEQAPHLVVYVPLAEAETHEALIEAIAAGTTIYPGANPWQRNTRLAVIVDHAIRGRIGDPRTDYIVRELEAGRLSPADVDRLVEQGGDGSGHLLLIFGSADPLRIARDFLSSERHDRELVERGALPELGGLFAEKFGIRNEANLTPSALRGRLAVQALVTDLRESTGEDLPELTYAAPSERAAVREACRTLARDWRNSRDLRDSYVAWAGRVERDLQIFRLSLDLNALAKTETFLSLEEALQRAVESALVAGPNGLLLAIAEARRSGFWAETRGEIQARWSLIATAGRVMQEADRVEQALKGAPAAVESLVQSYTAGEQPWCLLDTEQRHMERLFHLFELDPGGRHEQLERLVARARQRYMGVASTLAEHFLRAYAAAGFSIAGTRSQRQVFSRSVAPALKQGKAAYLLVDALRFEMARELVERLQGEYLAVLEPAIATAPTITEIGMAALLPGPENGLRLLAVGMSQLAASIDGAPLHDRAGRLAFLKARAGVPVFDAKLGDLLPARPATRAKIQAADLIVITSQEIDEWGEGDNIEAARRQMDDVLVELARAVQVLLVLGVETIVISADHGFIFGDELDEGMKVDPPGGETLDLHRRVWIGRGGAESPAYLRVPIERLGLEGDVDLATPWGFGGFKVRGGARLLPRRPVAPRTDRSRRRRHCGAGTGRSAHRQLRVDATTRQRESHDALLLCAGRRPGEAASRYGGAGRARRIAQRQRDRLTACLRFLRIRRSHALRAATVR